MTQSTEQKVRTRDEQVADLVEALSDEVWLPDHKSYCEKMLAEAEARGAAEERAKSIGYLFDNPDTGTEYLPYHPIESGECQGAENIREATSTELLSELQTAWTSWKEDRDEKERVSANVAALEARVKELEGDAARFAWVAENTGCFWYGLPGFGPERGRSYENRMKDLRSAIDRNMARAALTREGGV